MKLERYDAETFAAGFWFGVAGTPWMLGALLGTLLVVGLVVGGLVGATWISIGFTRWVLSHF